jgi:GxxExxY protein
MEVHKELGCGFQEAVYHEALEKEFGTQNIPFTSQPVVKLSYKGKVLSDNCHDIVHKKNCHDIVQSQL